MKLHPSTVGLFVLVVLVVLGGSLSDDDVSGPRKQRPLTLDKDKDHVSSGEEADDGADLFRHLTETSNSLSAEEFDYADVLHKSILFYEAQRSGKLPENNRISWRGDSALDDGSDVGVNLTGGWYDGGDHIKVNLPMAFSTTMLGWGLLEFWDAYVDAGELGNMLDSIRWPCEYFIKCHPSEDVYYYAVGDPVQDHDYWGRPEGMNMSRPTWTCTSDDRCADVAGESAAALATCALAFSKESEYRDDEFANQCLDTAISLHAFGLKKPGVQSPIVSSDEAVFYPSTRSEDELAWASLWLYFATGSEYHPGLWTDSDGDEMYLDIAVQMFYTSDYALKAKTCAVTWNDKRTALQLLLFKATEDKICKKKVAGFVNTWARCIKKINGGLSVRPDFTWGSNGIAANAAFVALLANKYQITKGSDVDKQFEWARQQIHFILGDGAGHSFMIGFGENQPNQPHHRGSTCPVKGPCGWPVYRDLSKPNANMLTGAIVGGPNDKGEWFDLRNDFIRNEVTTYYNSGFQSAVAALLHLQIKERVTKKVLPE